MGAERALRACALPVGETGGSKCQGEPGGGGSPARQGRSLEAGLHKRMGRLAMVRRLRTARKTGETARVGAGMSRRFTLARARGGAH